MPKISIVVPAYKVEPYLHRCVDSILGQSYDDFDLILVDDGSPDNCGAICDDYAAKDSRIHVIHQVNRGLSAARNAGIDWAFANSDSQWLCFVDSDDWVHRDYLRLLLEAVQSHGADISICESQRTAVRCEDAPLSSVHSECMDPDSVFFQRYELCTCAWNKLYRKELFRKIRYPVGKLYEDAYTTHLVLFATEKIAVVSASLYYYFENQESITRSGWSDRKLQSIEAHELRMAYLKEHGFSQAYRRQKGAYVEELVIKIRELLESRERPQDEKDILRLLQNKLRSGLKSACQADIFPFNRENMWAYLYAMKTDAVWKTARAAQKVYHKLKY